MESSLRSKKGFFLLEGYDLIAPFVLVIGDKREDFRKGIRGALVGTGFLPSALHRDSDNESLVAQVPRP